VAIADRIVITKTDLRAAATPAVVADAALQIAPDIAVHEAQDPDFSLAALFRAGPELLEGVRSRTRSTLTADSGHEGAVGSFTMELPPMVDWPAFTIWLSALLHAHGDRILRVKGLVRTSSGSKPLIIHGVQHTMHPPTHLSGADDGRPSFLVFITHDLEKGAIEASLARFLDLASTAAPPRPAMHRISD
jgi:G3E family GTPase